MQADRWLQDFQRTIDAWQVQRDFEELPSEAFRPLRDSLNISLAVAALAVHVPADDWGDGGIITWLRDEMNSHPEFIPSFLELLRVLPEEVVNYKIAARPDRRRQFEKELASAIETALNILTACLNINELMEQVRTSKRFMGVTTGAMLEEIQGLYGQHHQPCFLYLSSEVIKIFGSDPTCANYLKVLIESLFSHTACLLTKIQDFTSRPDIADDCFLLASRCIRYCPQLLFPSPVFPSLVDCAMVGITVQHREASNSILNFLSDIFDLANSTQGESCLSIRDSVIIPRGPTITRILVACLTGALPSSRLETVTYALLALTRTYGLKALEWAKECVSLIPSTAATEMERTRFLQALSDAASGANMNNLVVPIEELSEVCRRNRTVQEIVQGALRPLDLNIIAVS